MSSIVIHEVQVILKCYEALLNNFTCSKKIEKIGSNRKRVIKKNETQNLLNESMYYLKKKNF
jgi:hypothetical protein